SSASMGPTHAARYRCTSRPWRSISVWNGGSLTLEERSVPPECEMSEYQVPGTGYSARTKRGLTPLGACSDRLELGGVAPLPLLGVGAEVDEARLLPLLRRVQHHPLVEAGLGRDRVEHVLALLLRAPVRHREQVVRPVRVGRPL